MKHSVCVWSFYLAWIIFLYLVILRVCPRKASSHGGGGHPMPGRWGTPPTCGERKLAFTCNIYNPRVLGWGFQMLPDCFSDCLLGDNLSLRSGNTGNIFLQLVLQHCCIASWNTLLCINYHICGQLVSQQNTMLQVEATCCAK